MIKSKTFQIIFLKETLLLLFALVWFWFSVGLWVDSNYSEKNLKPHYGAITRMDSVITRVKDKPFFKEITKQLRITLNTQGDKVFTLLTTKDFGYVSSKVIIGDTVTLFTKPKVWGIFGLKKSSDINHLIKDEIVIINYQDYKKSISGFFYFTLAFAIILFIAYVVKLRKRLWWDFVGYKKYQESI